MQKKKIAFRFASAGIILAALAALLACQSLGEKPVAEDIAASAMFRSAMVLQRDAPLPVWGWAQPGLRVSVAFAGQVKSGLAGEDGRWEIVLDPIPVSSEGRDFVIAYESAAKENARYELPEPREYRNVLVGDVWYCSGQSNMEYGMTGIADRDAELSDAEYPLIRIFLAGKTASGVVQRDPIGAWLPATRETLSSSGWYGFSAVGFTFGRKLFKDTGVPQGIIQAAYGGSPIDAWIPPEELKSTKGLERAAGIYGYAEKQWAKAKEKDPEAPHPYGAIYDSSQLKPAACYNSMLAPIAPYAVRGMLWYQGESDVGKGPVYTTAMGALIAAARRLFRRPDLPFYFAQIAPYQYGAAGTALPLLWEYQYAALAFPGTGMAVTVDVGDAKDIHPKRKREVGERLARLALRDVYGMDVDAEGPTLLKAAIQEPGQGVALSFAHAEEGLETSDGGEPRGFFLAGADGIFKPAQATLADDGRSVVLVAEGIAEPKAVRYAWSDVPDANLRDKHGLPARPFSAEVK